MYELYIGNHLLKGKISNLTKPLILTDKIQNAEGNKEYVIKGVVKKKLMFGSRPTPLKREDQVKRMKLD